MDPPTEEETAVPKEEPVKKPDPSNDDDAPDIPKSAPPATPELADEKATAQDTSSASEKKNEEREGPQPLEERSAQFLELRSYEAKRRTIYSQKMTSTSLYWRSFRDLLSKAYQETDRAELLIKGTLAANESYEQFLRSAADDRLDHDGKPVDERRGRKLREERRKKYDSLGGGNLLLGLSIEQDRLNQEKERKKQAEEKAAAVGLNDSGISDAATTEGLPDGSLVTSLVESQYAMADVFTENVTFVKEVVMEKMYDLRKELEAELSVMSALGDATMYELKRAEDDVQKAWSAYYSLAQLVDTDSHAARAQKASMKGNDPNAITDVWLLEMHYRMSVAYLTTVWEKSASELSTLFAGMKEMECNRRIRLRGLLESFMERAERLWTGIPPVLKPVIDGLNSSPSNVKDLGVNVSETVRDYAQRLKEEEVNKQPHPLNGPGLAGVPEPDNEFELQSPLMSDLLCKVEVIWRKSEKLMAVWKPCLAITTSDSYLHLFEMPANATDIQTGSKPDAAFQALVPPVYVPTEESILEGVMPSARSWFEHLVPGVSMDLKNSNITLNQQKGNSTFEITETLAPSGISKLAKNVRKRKYSIRLYSSEHMVDWLLALRALGAE